MKSIVFQLIILYFFCFAHPVYAQNQNSNTKYSIDWNNLLNTNQTIYKANKTEFPRFIPEKYGKLPLISLKVQVSNNVTSVKINILSSQKAEEVDNNFDDKIQDTISYKYTISSEKKQKWLSITMLPFFKNSNGISKVIDYEIVIEEKNTEARILSQKKNSTILSQNSVLASGNWYKFAVKEEAIYKISGRTLKDLGINIASINPHNIKLYGNGGKALPQKNSEQRIDDLYENSIKIIGTEDGKFDNEDYILFYANGHVNWEYSSAKNEFIRNKNHYSDSSYYYLSLEGISGKRISITNSNGLSPNQIVNYYDDLQHHEIDNYTLITETLKSGREWYGEDFEFNSSRNFGFNFTDLEANSLANIHVNMALRSNVTSSAQIKVNNQTIGSLSAGSVPLQYETEFAKSATLKTSFTPNSNNSFINISYNKPNSSSNAWLNFIELHLRKTLKGNSLWLRFRDYNSVGANNISQFSFNSDLSGKEIWDVTDMYNPQAIEISNNSFITRTDILKEFVLFSPSTVKEPTFITKVQNQNLHALANRDMIIISPPDFLSEARRLANFRNNEQGISSHIVTPEQIYNEFSSGKKDPSAIRDFVKMFYDRAGSNVLTAPKYLLLFGSGSFDSRGLKFTDKNQIITYQSRNSLSPTESYTSDDFFGLLDNDEGDFPEDYTTSPGLLDIAVGRLPVTTVKEAKDIVDKLINYSNNSQFGEWRNKIAIVADDEDYNTHFNQSEANSSLINQGNKNINIEKIYLDAYTQESAASGVRYPQVQKLINDKIENGILLMNYTGHGGEGGWAEERILQVEDINKWSNTYLPTIFTATCSFGRWDDPEITSAGVIALKKENSGTVGIFTTTRIVYASYNFDLNQSFLRSLFDPSFALKRPSFGEVFKMAKNNNIDGLNINSRNFTLLGDPSALFALPQNRIATSFINNQAISATDTIKALQKVNVKGVLQSPDGAVLNDFNGIIYPIIYDKPSPFKTLGQDATSNSEDFSTQSNIIYKGKASVKDGAFSFDFLVPKDINLNYGKGKISYYADNNLTDAAGNYSELIIGGLDDKLSNDKLGPEINLYLNDNSFVSGGITNTSPIIFAEVKDENGINTTGLGIGHDIVATLTFQGKSRSIILNEFYESKMDSYQEGTIKHLLSDLELGVYSLKLKVWDVFNNSSEKTIEFEVKVSEQLAVNNVLNYPNPFTNRTNFCFEHNQVGQDLDVQVNIYTIAGRLVKSIYQHYFSAKSRIDNIFWDGKDEFGEKLARGVYVYQIKVRSSMKTETQKKIQKLVIL